MFEIVFMFNVLRKILEYINIITTEEKIKEIDIKSFILSIKINNTPNLIKNPINGGKPAIDNNSKNKCNFPRWSNK